MYVFCPIGFFTKDEETGEYNGYSPNVSGAFSCGDSIEEAIANLTEAVEGVMECALEEGYNGVLKACEFYQKENEIATYLSVNPRLRVAATIHLNRELLGLSQNAFAEKVGMQRETISRYERGHRMPSADKFLFILEASSEYNR